MPPNSQVVRDFISKPAKVGSLTGLGGGAINNHRMTGYCQSAFIKTGFVMQKIQYPASLAPTSIADGVEAADYWCRHTAGKKILFAMSQGAQVASDLLDEYASDPSAPGPDELMFVLIGNPRDSWRGRAAAEGLTEVDGGVAQYVRTDTDYRVVQGKVRYDGYADYPFVTSNAEAMKNSNLGKSIRHNKYPLWDLYDPRNTVWFENENTLHVLSSREQFGLPRYDNWVLKPAPCVAAARFARVEKAFNRPPNDPPIVIPKPRNRLEEIAMHFEGLSEYIRR